MADPLHLHEMLDDLVVRQAAEVRQRQAAVRDARGEIAQVADLLARQAAARIAASSVGGEHVLGARPLARIQLAEAAVDRACRFAGQLLEHDRSHERVVVGAGLPGLGAGKDRRDR